MSEAIISELETAAKIILAPPLVVTPEQRHSAEKIFLDFRKTKSPYELCRQILETSTVDFVLFEAADLLKHALINEWRLLEEVDIVCLRQYLMQYIIQKQIPSFIRDRILRVIAIIIKRASVEDFGIERAKILTEVEGLIMNGDLSKQVLGLNLISILMQEYATTVKSTDVGLAWESHFRAKKQFEVTDLRRIFQFCIRILGEINKMEVPFNENVSVVLKHLLAICESILTWGYISPMLPKRIIGVFEAVYESDQAPALRLTNLWKDVMFNSDFLPLMFSIYWKVRKQEQLAHHSLSCLVQLASLNGAIMNQKETKVQYLHKYMEGFLNLIMSVELQDKEALSLSNVIRKLLMFFPANVLTQLPENMTKTFLENITVLTCRFAEGSAKEEYSCGEDKYFSEAFDNILEAWSSLLQDDHTIPEELIKQCSVQIFNVYVQCHLSPPDGNRNCSDGEEIEETEDNDRIKFKDQLQSIGLFGRNILDHSMKILSHFLEERTQKLKLHLQQMQSRAMTIAESKVLDNIFEDIHWIVLITGHVLCMESDGETPLIPKEIMKYSIDQAASGKSSIDSTLKYLAASQQLLETSCENCDIVVRLTGAVLRLCALETLAAETNLGAFMSPEVGCTLMWFLNRWSLSYLLPLEMYYSELSQPFISAFGRDTPGAEFVFHFLLMKVRNNICHFNSEPVLLQDTVNLFISLVEKRYKAAYTIKSDELWNLVNLQFKLEPGMLPQAVKRGLFKAFVLAGVAVDESNQSEYWKRILTPVQVRFKTILCQENFNRIYQEEIVKTEIIDILESFIGITTGSHVTTVNNLFNFMSPILSELSVLLNLYHNYQVIVQLILELFCECAKQMLCYLSHKECVQIYEYCLATIQVYARCNSNRLTTDSSAEENSFQDLLLVMELLTNLLSKDCVDLSMIDPLVADNITAVDVCLYGINFIMPLMTMDLLKYPALCAKYYKLIMFVSELYPHKISVLPEDLLQKLIGSVELGLSHFGPDVLMSCLDFIQVLASHIHNSESKDTAVYRLLMPILKILLDLILSHQIGSEMFNAASTSLFALICCYSDQYQAYVQNLIQSQTDPTVAQRLVEAFTELTTNIELKPERSWKLKFRDSFDKFIVNVHGFLLVK